MGAGLGGWRAGPRVDPGWVRLASRQRCEWAEGQPERETSPGVGRRVLSGRLCPVRGLWRGLHDSSKSDLAGGNQDKEAGTPHPPLLELSSAPVNAPALGSPGQHPRSSLGDPLLLSLRTPSLLQLSATLPKLTWPSRQEPKPASPNARGFPLVVPEYLLSGYFYCEGKQRPSIQYFFVWDGN